MADNHLYYGDNLGILRRYVREESVDLITLDPTFNDANLFIRFAAMDSMRVARNVRMK